MKDLYLEHSVPCCGRKRCWKLTPTSAPSHRGDIGEGNGVPTGGGGWWLYSNSGTLDHCSVCTLTPASKDMFP